MMIRDGTYKPAAVIAKQTYSWYNTAVPGTVADLRAHAQKTLTSCARRRPSAALGASVNNENKMPIINN